MADLLIGNVLDGLIVQISTPAGGIQLQYLKNFLNAEPAAQAAYSNGIMSYHQLNVPGSISFNFPHLVISNSNGTGTVTVQLGLYSMNASTLSLANSASGTYTWSANTKTNLSLVTSAVSNIPPGEWFWGINLLSAGNSSFSVLCNTSLNLANAQPFFVFGRATASTSIPPGSIATSVLDITGSDANRQPYILLNA